MLPNTELFGIPINWYTFFPRLGFVVALIFAIWYYFKKATFRLSLLQLVGMIALLYFLMLGGGRIVSMFEYYLNNGVFPDINFLFKSPNEGGFRWSGSLMALLLFLPFLSKKILRIRNLNAFFDLMVLFFCLFTAILKQACQFSGDGCYGIPTTLPWGMYYPYGNAPNFLPVHPTPIYDSLFHLVLFIGLLNWDLKHKKMAGQTAKIYFIVVPLFYILLELIRINPVVAHGITLPQLVYALILLIGLPIFLYQNRLLKAK